MKHPHTGFVAILLIGSLSFLAVVAGAQGGRRADSPQVSTAARVESAGDASPGTLYVTVGGRERKVADKAIRVWVVEDGRRVVYSGPDGAGGYENEGQSLRAFDPATGSSRKIMSAYHMIDDVTEVKTRGGKTALLVRMSDGGLGANYVSVVDPERGEVFFRRWARVVSRSGDTVVLGHYREADWEKFHQNENANVRPYRTERVNLGTVLRRRVITRPRSG
ncbi:MAG TPA: hypothetical protein VEY09_01005 [Pyrinomonadaceae bacterium]|nr:hypothetical protein [Pyrinomonadaceae bacterium]